MYCNCIELYVKCASFSSRVCVCVRIINKHGKKYVFCIIFMNHEYNRKAKLHSHSKMFFEESMKSKKIQKIGINSHRMFPKPKMKSCFIQQTVQNLKLKIQRIVLIPAGTAWLCYSCSKHRKKGKVSSSTCSSVQPDLHWWVGVKYCPRFWQIWAKSFSQPQHVEGPVPTPKR